MSDQANHSQHRSSPLLQRIAVSLSTGLATYVLTNLTEQPQIWVITLSVFTAGTVLVVQFLIGLEEAMRDGLQQANQATHILRKIESSALPTQNVLQLLDNISEMRAITPPVALDMALTNIDKTSELISGLNRGEIAYRGEDRDWLLYLTDVAKISIDAMSPATDGSRDFLGGFWESDLGQRYLNAQKTAAKVREVKVRRIFIIQNAEIATSGEFRRMCNQQTEKGIEVGTYIGTSDDAEYLHDWVIFDSRLSYRISPQTNQYGATRSPLLRTEISLIPVEVEDNVRTFDNLWQRSRRWPSGHDEDASA